MKIVLEIDLTKLDADKGKRGVKPEAIAEFLAFMIRRGELEGMIWPGADNDSESGYRVTRVTPSVKSKR